MKIIDLPCPKFTILDHNVSITQIFGSSSSQVSTNYLTPFFWSSNRWDMNIFWILMATRDTRQNLIHTHLSGQFWKNNRGRNQKISKNCFTNCPSYLFLILRGKPLPQSWNLFKTRLVAYHNPFWVKQKRFNIPPPPHSSWLFSSQGMCPPQI